MLAYLASRAGQAVSRQQLLEDVWHSSDQWQDPATVTEHVRRLRKKIEADPEHPKWLQTVRGVGYRFDPSPGSSLEAPAEARLSSRRPEAVSSPTDAPGRPG